MLCLSFFLSFFFFWVTSFDFFSTSFQRSNAQTHKVKERESVRKINNEIVFSRANSLRCHWSRAHYSKALLTFIHAHVHKTSYLNSQPFNLWNFCTMQNLFLSDRFAWGGEKLIYTEMCLNIWVWGRQTATLLMYSHIPVLSRMKQFALSSWLSVIVSHNRHLFHL